MSQEHTVTSLSSETDHPPVHLERDNRPITTSNIIGWSALRGYHHISGCSVCDTLALHLPEAETLLSGSIVAIFQRDNYEFSIRHLATQSLQQEVDRLYRVVHVLQEELQYHYLKDPSVVTFTNGNDTSGTNGIAHEVGDDPSIQ